MTNKVPLDLPDLAVSLSNGSEALLDGLYKAKCKDLDIKENPEQRRKFF